MTTSVDKANEGYSKEAMDKLNKIWDDLDAQAILKHSENNEHIAAKARHRDRRERIAKVALQGLLSNTQWLPEDTTYNQIAEYATRAADALIHELDKPQ